MDAKLLELSHLIVEKGIDKNVLDKIASVFAVDACSIVGIKDFDLTLVENSSYFDKVHIDIKSLYRKTKDQDLLLYKAIKKEVIVVEDYQNMKGVNPLWKDIGIKSILLYKLGSEFNAVLALENFSGTKRFTRKDLEKLKFLDVFISKSLENKIFKEFLINDILNLDVKPPNCNSISCLKKWVESNLGKILYLTKAKAVSLVFPKRNLYAFVTPLKEFNRVYFKKTESVKSLLTYKMFTSKLKGPSVFNYEFSKDKLRCMKLLKENFSINNILVIPIWEANDIVATVGYGYVKDYLFSLYDINLTTLVAKRLIEFLDEEKEFYKLRSIVTKSEEEIINSFVITIEMKDVYTKGHSQRVAFYSRKIAEALKIREKEIERIYIAGLLHDIGKISLPDAVLLKPSSLSKVEFEIIKYHPVLSYEIVNTLKSLPDLKSIAETVRHHHEKCDGSGYPDGLKCSKISRGARILAIADVFDALTTSRPYRRAFDVDKAIDIMFSEKWHFDFNILSKVVGVLKVGYSHAIKFSESSVIPKAFDEYKRKFSDIDYLTGLLKREAFLRNIEALMELGESFRIYMIDVKDMDFINLVHSSVFGDKLLISIASVLEELRKFGVLFISRFGGDSFVFVVPLGNKDNSREGIEKILVNFSRRVSENLFKNTKKRIKVDFSVAYVDSKDGDTPMELVYILRQKKRKSVW